MTLFTIKYAPQNTAQIFGQPLAISQLKEFVLNHKKQKQKAALLYGPIGVGKTASVYALAKELNYDILELNSSDLRDEDSMKSFLGSALGQQSLFFTPKIILIDEIDNISGREDRGCIPALVAAIEKANFPVVMTANDPFDSKFKPLQKASLMIEFQPLQYKTIAHAVQWVCEQEKIMFEEKTVNTLARQVDGDMRAALIDLQGSVRDGALAYDVIVNLSNRKRAESILQALAIIFKSSAAENCVHILDDVDMDMNEVMLWLDENLPLEYTSASALAKAYEALARADVFTKRIKKQQYWRLLVYVSNLLTVGISSAKTEKNSNFVAYKPTSRILKIWMANQRLAKKKQIAEKWAKATHTSKKVAMGQMPYVQAMFQKKVDFGVVKEVELNEEEVEWLRGK